MPALLKKELKLYFLTPVGWIFLAVFLLVSGIMFSLNHVFAQNPEYGRFLSSLIFLFLLVVPLLTMRIFTDEKRFKTEQLLLTAPASLWSIVIGKYLAALIVFLISMAVTILYPVSLSFYGRMDWVMILGTYFGFILLGASFIAIGVFISQAVEGPVGAAILTFCTLMVTFIIDFLSPYMPTVETAGFIWALVLAAVPVFLVYQSGKNVPVTIISAAVIALILALVWFLGRDFYLGFIGKSLGWISLTRRYGSFTMGVLRLDAVLYYLSFSGFFLFLTVQGLEKRRWN